jgi:hypothetical protein
MALQLIPLGPPSFDSFTPLSQIGKSFSSNYDDARKRAIEDQRKAALAEESARTNGNVNLGSLGKTLLGVGDLEGALTAARLAETQGDRQFLRQTNERDFGYRQQQDAETNRQRQEALNLQREIANRKTVSEGYRALPGGGYEAIPGGPQDPAKIRADAEARNAAKPKDLAFNVVKELGERGAAAGDFNRIAGGFKDEFAGYKLGSVVGEAANTLGRNTNVGNFGEQAQWWQEYQSKKNIIRNQLFGSALTATEAGEFNKADINPGMTPDQVRTNLQRQAAAAKRAAGTLAKYYITTGVDPVQIEAALGYPLADLGITPPAGPAMPSGVAPQQSAPPARLPFGQRFQQLTQSGMSKSDAFTQMQSEGY